MENENKVVKFLTTTKIVAIIGILVVVLGLWLPCKGVKKINGYTVKDSNRDNYKEVGYDLQPQGIDSWEGQIILICTGLTVVIVLADVLAKGVKNEKVKNILNKISDMRLAIIPVVISAIMLILYAALKNPDEAKYFVHVGYYFMWIGEVVLAIGAFVYNPKKAVTASAPVEKTEEQQ